MKKLILAVLLGSSVAAFSLPAAAEIYVNIAPPAPRYEVVPAPRVGYVWIPGYYDWRGNRHVWTRGRWERERHGYHYHPTRWTERDGRWALENEGVTPDIEVENTPAAEKAGHDLQLERAVQEALKLLEQSPVKRVPRPAPINRTSPKGGR